MMVPLEITDHLVQVGRQPLGTDLSADLPARAERFDHQLVVLAWPAPSSFGLSRGGAQRTTQQADCCLSMVAGRFTELIQDPLLSRPIARQVLVPNRLRVLLNAPSAHCLSSKFGNRHFEASNLSWVTALIGQIGGLTARAWRH